MAEKVIRTGVQKQSGWLYFIRGNGVWRSAMAQGLHKGSGQQHVVPVEVPIDKSFLYHLDRDGDIARAPRRGAL